MEARESLQFLHVIVSVANQTLYDTSDLLDLGLELGDSSSLICGFTNRSNATSGTNKLGLGPVEFLMAVLMS